jgi:hypothetical protein
LGPPARAPFPSDPRNNQKSGGVPAMVKVDLENFPTSGERTPGLRPPTRTVGDFTVPTVPRFQAGTSGALAGSDINAPSAYRVDSEAHNWS